MGAVYEPSEDSYFFADVLAKYLQKHSFLKTHLDMGTGSGVLAETTSVILGKKHVTAADINSDAVSLVNKKGIKAVRSNLFTNLHGAYDLITFNAPYLPADSREPKDSQTATTGGKQGDEISVAFLQQAKRHLTPHGKILLLISSLTPRKNIAQFKPRIIARKKLFMEELLILEFSH